MAMAAQLYDRDFEGTLKEEDVGNAATPFVQAWNLLGFCGGAAFAVVLLRAQDGNQGVSWTWFSFIMLFLSNHSLTAFPGVLGCRFGHHHWID